MGQIELTEILKKKVINHETKLKGTFYKHNLVHDKIKHKSKYYSQITYDRLYY